MADEVLQHVIKEGFTSVHRRMDDITVVMRGVAHDVSDMNGRVTRVETRVDLLAPPTPSLYTNGEAGHISVSDVKWYLGIAGGAIGSTLAVLRFLGKI